MKFSEYIIETNHSIVIVTVNNAYLSEMSILKMIPSRKLSSFKEVTNKTSVYELVCNLHNFCYCLKPHETIARKSKKIERYYISCDDVWNGITKLTSSSRMFVEDGVIHLNELIKNMITVENWKDIPEKEDVFSKYFSTVKRINHLKEEYFEKNDKEFKKLEMLSTIIIGIVVNTLYLPTNFTDYITAFLISSIIQWSLYFIFKKWKFKVKLNNDQIQDIIFYVVLFFGHILEFQRNGNNVSYVNVFTIFVISILSKLFVKYLGTSINYNSILNNENIYNKMLHPYKGDKIIDHLIDNIKKNYVRTDTDYQEIFFTSTIS